jgi:hypothetical protein
MSTIILIVVGLVAALAIVIGIGYLLERYGVTAKIKELFDRLKENFPTYKRWLVTGLVALGLLIAVIVLLVIIF